jgi:DNA-binding transcriptional LysR family regulator
MAMAECGSMGKAAKQLAISQPVVSKVIANLERMLGAQLFDRNSHGVEPTHYGIALLKHGIAVFDDLKTSVDEIKFLALRTPSLFDGLNATILFQDRMRVVAGMKSRWARRRRITWAELSDKPLCAAYRVASGSAHWAVAR